MSTTIRTFIAVPVDAPGALRKICRQLQQMGRPIKAVAVENLHLTLRFLGQTELDQIRSVSKAIHSVACESFDLDLVGLGAFPHARRPRVVWAGIRGAEPVAAMAQALEAPLSELGWAPEGRAWRAHVTLARVNGTPSGQLFELLDQHRDTQLGQVTVDSVILMQSQFGGHRGPMYVPLETVALG